MKWASDEMTSKGNYLASIYQREEAMPLLAYTAKKDYNRELLIYSKKIIIPTFKGLQLLQWPWTHSPLIKLDTL